MLAQQDRDVAHEGNKAHHATYYVLFAVEEGLALCVELGVIRKVVVALGEQAKGCLAVKILILLFTLARPA